LARAACLSRHTRRARRTHLTRSASSAGRAGRSSRARWSYNRSGTDSYTTLGELDDNLLQLHDISLKSKDLTTQRITPLIV
jgi:hypothetical protein